MGVQEKSKTIQVATPKDKEIIVFVTSDGKEYMEKTQAEIHQKRVDDINAFKKSIMYADVSVLGLVPERYGYNSTSFVFEWSQEAKGREDNYSLFRKLTCLNDISVNELVVGEKYIVIEFEREYNDCASDFYGYFGAIQDYIMLLEKETEKIKLLL